MTHRRITGDATATPGAPFAQPERRNDTGLSIELPIPRIERGRPA
jgi:hypothetical protein